MLLLFLTLFLIYFLPPHSRHYYRRLSGQLRLPETIKKGTCVCRCRGFMPCGSWKLSELLCTPISSCEAAVSVRTFESFSQRCHQKLHRRIKAVIQTFCRIYTISLLETGLNLTESMWRSAADCTGSMGFTALYSFLFFFLTTTYFPLQSYCIFSELTSMQKTFFFFTNKIVE